MGTQVSTRLIALHPRNVFRISRAARRETVNVFLRIERDGVVGFGEASANAFYGENAEEVARLLMGMSAELGGSKIMEVEEIETAWENYWPDLEPSRAAQCALNLALLDWVAKFWRASVSQLVLGREGLPVKSFVTVGISTPEELEAKLEEIADFPMVKVKADGSGNLETVRRVREAMPEAQIAVDANCAWGELDWGMLGAELRGLGVEFVEQPLPPARDEEMGKLREEIGLPVMADESCVTLEDIERVPGRFDGFNIKLVKCGGLTPALRMARRGRELGLKTMVGCMLESSVLIAAGAVAAQLTDYADLDGAWLLADDPARGWIMRDGMLMPPAGAGLGVEWDEGAAG